MDGLKSQASSQMKGMKAPKMPSLKMPKL